MPPRVSFTGPFGLSIAALALVAIFLLVTLPSLLGAVFVAGAGSAEPRNQVDKLIARHDEAMKTYQDRFNGRSAFFKPPPKYVPPPPQPKPRDEPPPPPPEPVAPMTYQGPSLAAILGDEVWFKPPTANDKTGFVLREGETEPKSGVKLLEINAPWNIKVAHKGGEYTVGFASLAFDEKKGEAFFASDPKNALPIPWLTIIQPPPGVTTQPDSAMMPSAPPGISPAQSAGAARMPGRRTARPVKSAAERTAEAEQRARETGEQQKPAQEEPVEEPAPDQTQEPVDEELEEEDQPQEDPQQADPQPAPVPPPTTEPAQEPPPPR